MRVIIAGSRTIHDASLIRKAVEQSGFKPTEIITGGAQGVDSLGDRYAKQAGINRIIFPANWIGEGKAGGPIRNERMAIYASSDKGRPGGLIAIWDGASRGTKSMIDLGSRYGLKVFIYRIDLR